MIEIFFYGNGIFSDISAISTECTINSDYFWYINIKCHFDDKIFCCYHHFWFSIYRIMYNDNIRRFFFYIFPFSQFININVSILFVFWFFIEHSHSHNPIRFHHQFSQCILFSTFFLFLSSCTIYWFHFKCDCDRAIKHWWWEHCRANYFAQIILL